jgi:hypothetical protein
MLILGALLFYVNTALQEILSKIMRKVKIVKIKLYEMNS